MEQLDPLLKGTRIGPTVVGFLDLLGVSQRVVEQGLGDLLTIYEQGWLSQEEVRLVYAAHGVFESQRVDKFMFSDSVLFFSQWSSITNLATTVAVTAGTMMAYLLNDMTASRGVIALGDMGINLERHIFCRVASCPDCSGRTRTRRELLGLYHSRQPKRCC